MGGLSIWHWIVVIAVLLLLFGRGKISELMGDVAQGINAKLVRRHPHVFGEVEASTSGQVLANWEAIKRTEKAARGEDQEGSADPTAQRHADERSVRGAHVRRPPASRSRLPASREPGRADRRRRGHRAPCSCG